MAEDVEAVGWAAGTRGDTGAVGSIAAAGEAVGSLGVSAFWVITCMAATGGTLGDGRGVG